MLKLNAKQLRNSQLVGSLKNKKSSKRANEIYLILDNVLDTFNVGSIFRLADATGVKKIYLCGGTETPPNHRIKKASINTTEWVEWEYSDSALLAISKLKAQIPNIQVVAIELSEKAVSYTEYDYKYPIALVVGHESEGVSGEVLELCDGIVELPMYGVNVSLNVMVTTGIVLYRVLDTVL